MASKRENQSDIVARAERIRRNGQKLSRKRFRLSPTIFLPLIAMGVLYLIGVMIQYLR